MLLVHVVWATLRRRPLLQPSFDHILVAIIGKKARDLDCVLLAAGCGSDHVHSLLRLAPSARLADLVQRIKGGSAYDANHQARVPEPIHWQAGYWAESLGPGDFEPLADYVRSQRIRHDPSHPAERWQFDDDWEPALLGGL
jgi:putative transposase